MAGQIGFARALIYTSVFAVCLTLFFLGFALDNNTQISLGDDPNFNSTSNLVLGNLTTYRTETINATDSFYKSEIQEGETVRTGGQFKLGPSTALGSVDNILTQGFRSVFGEDSEFGWIFTTLIVFLSFMLGLYIWKTWKGGLPD